LLFSHHAWELKSYSVSFHNQIANSLGSLTSLGYCYVSRSLRSQLTPSGYGLKENTTSISKSLLVVVVVVVGVVDVVIGILGFYWFTLRDTPNYNYYGCH
jgi:hypothetical protein